LGGKRVGRGYSPRWRFHAPRRSGWIISRFEEEAAAEKRKNGDRQLKHPTQFGKNNHLVLDGKRGNMPWGGELQRVTSNRELHTEKITILRAKAG